MQMNQWAGTPCLVGPLRGGAVASIVWRQGCPAGTIQV